MLTDKYYFEITKVLDTVYKTQKDNISKAAEAIAETIKNDGIIYMFGCGHSHLIALDCFYRAGGLANVCPVLDADLMLYDGAAKSSVLEKTSGIAEHVVKRYCLTENDTFVVISTSGGNAAPIEAAQFAKMAGATTISITSMAYVGKKPNHLSEVTDIVLDNCAPYGDAVIDIPNSVVKMGSVSTVSSSYLANSMILKAVEICAEQGIDVPAYKSGNIEGGAEYNKQIIDKYLPRIKHL